MPYTVLNLINNAFYTSGIVARDFQTVSGAQESVGLELINEILTEKVVDNEMIPYTTRTTFNGVVGQQTYFIPNLIELDTLVFFLQSVRYQMQQVQRVNYFGTPRAENINSLPVIYHVERALGGANIYVYFFPDQTYLFEAWGLFGLTKVAINQDLELTLDPFYVSYLKYALSDRLCTNYSYDCPSQVQKQLKWCEMNIAKRSQQMDLTMQKTSTLQRPVGFSWAQVNLGHGWVPAS